MIIVTAFMKALYQLTDSAFLRVIGGGVLLSLLLWIALWWGVRMVVLDTQWLDTSWQDMQWLERLLDAVVQLFAGVMAWILFPICAGAAIVVMLESIIVAVEKRNYPVRHGKALIARTIAVQVLMALRFLGILVLVNILLLPLLFFGLVYGVAFYTVNGYFVGREYFEQVALRHQPQAQVRVLFRRHFVLLTVFGVIVVLLLSVPFLNLIAPVIAVAAMVHLFEHVDATPVSTVDSL